MSQVPPTARPEPVAVTPPGNGMAVTGLVLGILGFCTAGVTAAVGLILGIVAMTRGSRSPGVAISATVVSGMALLVGPVMFLMIGLMLPALGKARVEAQSAMWKIMATELAMATEVYADDHGGALPPADGWVAAVTPYVTDITLITESPLADGWGRALAMNEAMAGVDISTLDPGARVVLFFEVTPGSGPMAGGVDDLAPEPLRPRVWMIAFTDGTASLEANPATLEWSPRN